ncbi:MAG: RNA polymerase sigma factor [Dehalococcoidia bacterium]
MRNVGVHEPLSRPGDVNVGERIFQDFAERYRQYFPRVFAYVYGRMRDLQAAEDIASEVFERAFVKADTLRHEQAFGTWLFTIARNLLISYCRKRNRFGGPVNYELVNSLPDDGAPEDDLLEREEVAKIMEYVRGFPQREQDVIALKFDAELTNAQIAEIMNVSESNVRVILCRTLQKLRKLLQEEA